MEDKKFQLACRAVIVSKGKLLVVKHPHDMSYAALPGGRLEFGERPKECLTREMMEELGVKPEIGRLLYISTYTEKEIHYTEFFFEVKNGEDYLEADKLERTHAHELAEIMWVSPTDDIMILPKKFGEDFKAGRMFSDDVRYIQD